MKIWSRWRVVTHLAAAVAMSVGVFLTPASAQEVVDTSVEGTTSVAAAVTYTVDSGNDQIAAEARVTVRNSGPAGSSAISDFSLVLPRSAGLSVLASRNGSPVDMRPGEISGEFVVWTFGLGRELGAGRTAEVLVHFTLTQLDDNRVAGATRFNSAYVSFPALGLGDRGSGSVRVAVPSWFEARWVELADFRTPPVAQPFGLAQVYDVSGVGEEFVAVVEARHDGSLEWTSLVLDGGDITVDLASWPGDDAWPALVEVQITKLMPALESLIGLPWPLEGTLVVRESNSGLVHGFGGSFSRTSSGGSVEIGPIVDELILAHELAHAWFDDRLDPWLSEGLASAFADLATGREPGVESVIAEDPDTIALESWMPLAGDPAIDRYGYAASAALVRKLLADLDESAQHGLVANLLLGVSAFGDVPGAAGVDDWQRLADASFAAGAEAGAEIGEWVLAEPPTGLLAARAESLELYTAFAERSAEWGVPAAIDIALTQWDFETADRALVVAFTLLDDRDELVERADSLGLMPPLLARVAFVDDTVTAARQLRDEARALDSVETARRVASSERTWLEEVGLWGVDIDSQVSGIEEAFSGSEFEGVADRTEALIERVDDANELGARRIAAVAAGVAVVLLIALLFAAGRARRRVVPR